MIKIKQYKNQPIIFWRRHDYWLGSAGKQRNGFIQTYHQHRRRKRETNNLWHTYDLPLRNLPLSLDFFAIQQQTNGTARLLWLPIANKVLAYKLVPAIRSNKSVHLQLK